jgi:hypothetical protein
MLRLRQQTKRTCSEETGDCDNLEPVLLGTTLHMAAPKTQGKKNKEHIGYCFIHPDSE